MPFTRNGSFALRDDAGDVVSKAARTATGSTGWVDIGDAREIVAQLDADAGTGTSPTLDVKLQTSWNAADATAVDVPSGAFTQVLAAASSQLKSLPLFHRYIKFVWTITGTTPSFNFGAYITVKK